MVGLKEKPKTPKTRAVDLVSPSDSMVVRKGSQVVPPSPWHDAQYPEHLQSPPTSSSKVPRKLSTELLRAKTVELSPSAGTKPLEFSDDENKDHEDDQHVEHEVEQDEQPDDVETLPQPSRQKPGPEAKDADWWK